MKTVDSVKKEIVDLLKSTEREYIEKRILSLVLGLLLLANAISAQQDCGIVSDHEGNRYKTVRIGTQCWMAENMRCKTSPSTGANILECPAMGCSYSGKKAYYYEDNPVYAMEGYGLLYNWCAAVDTFNVSFGETSTNISYDQTPSAIFAGNRRGICPEGWHIPSVAEWDTLVRYVSGQQEYLCNGYTAYIAKALASTEGWGIVPCDPNGIAEFLDPNTGASIFLECNSAKWFVFLCTCRSDTSLLSRTKHFSTFKQ